MNRSKNLPDVLRDSINNVKAPYTKIADDIMRNFQLPVAYSRRVWDLERRSPKHKKLLTEANNYLIENRNATVIVHFPDGDVLTLCFAGNQDKENIITIS